MSAGTRALAPTGEPTLDHEVGLRGQRLGSEGMLAEEGVGVPKPQDEGGKTDPQDNPDAAFWLLTVGGK